MATGVSSLSSSSSSSSSSFEHPFFSQPSSALLSGFSGASLLSSSSGLKCIADDDLVLADFPGAAAAAGLAESHLSRLCLAVQPAAAAELAESHLSRLYLAVQPAAAAGLAESHLSQLCLAAQPEAGAAAVANTAASQGAAMAGQKRRRADGLVADGPSPKVAKTDASDHESDSKDESSVSDSESSAISGAWGWNLENGLEDLIAVAQNAEKAGGNKKEVRQTLRSVLFSVDFSKLKFDAIWPALTAYLEWKGKEHDFKNDPIYQLIMGNLWPQFPVKVLEGIFTLTNEPALMPLKSWSFPSSRDILDWSIPDDGVLNAFLAQDSYFLEVKPYEGIWVILSTLLDAPTLANKAKTLNQLGTYLALATEAGREVLFWKLCQAMARKCCMLALVKADAEGNFRFKETLKAAHIVFKTCKRVKPLEIQFY